MRPALYVAGWWYDHLFFLCSRCPSTHRATAAPCWGRQRDRGEGSAPHIELLTCLGPATICSCSILLTRFLFGGQYSWTSFKLWIYPLGKTHARAKRISNVCQDICETFARDLSLFFFLFFFLFLLFGVFFSSLSCYARHWMHLHPR